ncbi:radical SAM family heme chaperone HemW [Conexibacter sp. SYSU D00693]|uniref:radical SAM family heme chaperone HemW n=1 Tax=Conexibacter sp. SYSU D00693 TaxID=2812560 RepID=UPI00196AE8B1|nr:radical SAM family heme chaperone HemW [Conexibacter sp. SYSU D00693]
MTSGSPAQLSFYVHVPFCATRCGYCDFVTYTADELPGGGAREAWADVLLRELDVARRELGPREVATVFFGGGTPTLLPARDLARVLEGIDARFGLAPGAEVTTEANPETVDPAKLADLRAAGFSRVSLGMQHVAPHVLDVLERVHAPGRPVQAAREARAAGFEHVSLDLIYGTPGETAADWDQALDAVLDAGVDHVSAYALIVEPGTRLAARVRRGEVREPDDDELAERYEQADARLAAAGLRWYEISNWAASDAARCHHNIAYWTGRDWWGAGPGAHSHVDGVRWWNAKHPTAWAERVTAGEVPAAGREVLTARERRTERLLLEVRLAEGLDAALLGPHGSRAAQRLADDGLVVVRDGRVVLTRRGRRLADTVTLALDDDRDAARAA